MSTWQPGERPCRKPIPVLWMSHLKYNQTTSLGQTCVMTTLFNNHTRKFKKPGSNSQYQKNQASFIKPTMTAQSFHKERLWFPDENFFFIFSLVVKTQTPRLWSIFPDHCGTVAHNCLVCDFKVGVWVWKCMLLPYHSATQHSGLPCLCADGRSLFSSHIGNARCRLQWHLWHIYTKLLFYGSQLDVDVAKISDL